MQDNKEISTEQDSKLDGHTQALIMSQVLGLDLSDDSHLDYTLMEKIRNERLAKEKFPSLTSCFSLHKKILQMILKYPMKLMQAIATWLWRETEYSRLLNEARLREEEEMSED